MGLGSAGDVGVLVHRARDPWVPLRGHLRAAPAGGGVRRAPLAPVRRGRPHPPGVRALQAGRSCAAERTRGSQVKAGRRGAMAANPQIMEYFADPPLARKIFSSTGFAWLWLIVCAWPGYNGVAATI